MTIAIIAVLSVGIDLTLCFLQLKPLFLIQCLFYTLPFIPISWPWQVIIGFLALLPSFCLQGVLGADLIVMIPLYVFLWYMRQTTDLPRVAKIFLSVLCVGVQAIMMRGIWVLSLWQLFIDGLFCLGMLYLYQR